MVRSVDLTPDKAVPAEVEDVGPPLDLRHSAAK